MARPFGLVIDDAPNVEILGGVWRNFAGVKTKYSAQGKRFFNLRLTDDQAEHFKELGANVKWREPKDENYDGFWYMKVGISEADNEDFRSYIYIIDDKGRKSLKEGDALAHLDRMRFLASDMSLRRYYYSEDTDEFSYFVRRAYLKPVVTLSEMEKAYEQNFVTVEEDEEIPFD